MTTENRWNNAISKAADINGEQSARYLGEGRFLIISASDPDNGAYEVRLTASDAATPATTCSCPAGEHGFPCWHQATALLMAGYADAPEPVVEPDVAARPDAAAIGAFLSNPQAIFNA